MRNTNRFRLDMPVQRRHRRVAPAAAPAPESAGLWLPNRKGSVVPSSLPGPGSVVRIAATAAKAHAEVAELRATLASVKAGMAEQVAAQVAEQVAERDSLIVSLGGTVPEPVVAPESSAHAGQAQFETYLGGADVGPERSRPALLKKQKTDLSGLSKDERLRIHRESLTAGDSWEDLHGTKDRPLKQTLRWARFAKKAKADGETSAAAAADALTDDRRPSVSQRV